VYKKKLYCAFFGRNFSVEMRNELHENIIKTSDEAMFKVMISHLADL
jgi:hypothetical protein